MRQINNKANKIMAAFQRYLTSDDRTEINIFSLTELRSANEQYGHRDLNAGFRIALLNRIKELEEKREDRRALSIRSTGYGLAFVIAVCSGLVVFYLTRD